MNSMLVDLELGRNAYGRLLRESMAEIPVDPREAVVLRLLAVNGPVTVWSVRRATGMPASTVTSVTHRLVAEGLVVRFRTRADRRYVWIELTQLGRLVAGMVATAVEDVAARVRTLPLGDDASLAGVAASLHELTTPHWLDPLS